MNNVLILTFSPLLKLKINFQLLSPSSFHRLYSIIIVSRRMSSLAKFSVANHYVISKIANAQKWQTFSIMLEKTGLHFLIKMDTPSMIPFSPEHWTTFPPPVAMKIELLTLGAWQSVYPL